MERLLPTELQRLSSWKPLCLAARCLAGSSLRLLIRTTYSLVGSVAGTLVGMDKDIAPQSVPEQASASEESAIVEELLVEEISIDGMCGVY